MRRNAEIVGLPALYAKGFLGQGQMVAAIELSGTWSMLREAISAPWNPLTKEQREKYRNNFLPAIGGPGLHPEEKNAHIRSLGDNPHGANVASVVLDLAPQAKVLPVSTYHTPGSRQRYDVANAVMDLAQRAHGNIINISAGDFDSTVISQEVPDANGRLIFVYKTVYILKIAEAFRRAVQEGKVLVVATGNEGLDIQPPRFEQNSKCPRSEIMAHLVKALDPETLRSVIFAGNLDPETRMASRCSNKPGNWEEAQKRFLFAPGSHEISYLPGFVVKGTSFAAPLICGAIAALCSKPGVTPKKAANALLESADERPHEKAIYGRGLMRADKALELLERGY
jgi:subtilisin family serine protease